MPRSLPTDGKKGLLATIAWMIPLIVTISKAQDFRIDNQLRILANDCYTRIAIGSRLSRQDVIATERGNSLTDCETACSLNRTICNAFSYGVSARGNGTCGLGRLNAMMAVGDQLTTDPDWDVYERRPRMPRGCQHDRLVRIGAGGGGNSSSVRRGSVRRRGPFFGGRVGDRQFFGGSNGTGDAAGLADREPSFIRGGWAAPIADDSDSRLYDILLNNGKTIGDSGPRWNPRPITAYRSPETSTADLCADSPIFDAHCRSEQPFLAWNPATIGSFARPSIDQFFPENPPIEPHQPIDHFTNDRPYRFDSDPLIDETKPCYRKLLAGKRLLDGHVRKSLACRRIEECHRWCEYEDTFVCEGFTYGQMRQDGARGRGGGYPRDGNMCQLTSVSSARMDPRRDFVDDTRYDYYERDWRCPGEKSPRTGVIRDWPIERPPTRDWRYPTPSRPYLPAVRPPAVQPPAVRPPPERPPSYGPYYPPNYSYYPPSYDNYPKYTPIPKENPRPYGAYLPPQIGPVYYPYRKYQPYPRFGPYPDRRMDEDRAWQPSGSEPKNSAGNYGTSYAYLAKNVPYGQLEPPRIGPNPNYPAVFEPPPAIPPKSRPDHDYGYNYGPAYGYDEKNSVNYSPPKPQYGKPWYGIPNGECSTRSATGFRLSRKILTASRTTASLEECETLCTARIDCLSFAFRYSLAPDAPTDNCLLSNVHFGKLDFYTQLEPDRDWDIYAIVDDPVNCRGTQRPVARPRNRPPEECFWRVRSGFEMPASLTRSKIRVENGLGDCQMACINCRAFTCRSFVYRYDSDGDRGPNCFLSDCPTNEMIGQNNEGAWSRGSELFERGSYGRGCEANPFSTIYPPAELGRRPAPNDDRVGDQGCYSSYENGCRLTPYAISAMSRVDSESQCRRQCSRMRQHSPPCMSFSFRLGDEKHGDNCYLSDVPRRDQRPGLDYTLDDDYVTYAWKDVDDRCRVPIGSPPALDFSNYNHLFLGVRPLDAPDSPDYPSGNSPHDGAPEYDGGSPSLNRYYTVNGYPCKRGTKCEKNRIAGFWSCEPEGAEFGSWDYCCEPQHHCGYSQGHRYPWCYVGPSEDQWRPCSDEYYPYLPSPRPAIGPSLRRENDPYPQPNVPQDYPGSHCARHWPISYLHPVPPPNSTDSVAQADDRQTLATESSTTASTTTETTETTENSHLRRRGLNPPNGTRDFRLAAYSSNFERKIRPTDSALPGNGTVVQKVTAVVRAIGKENLPREKIEEKGKKNAAATVNNTRVGRVERVTKAATIFQNIEKLNNSRENNSRSD